ncbi:MauE/DoxX family redox-associated membrane protein [Rothia sp. ZJ932]|uniref:MauE/DoxX family redox-associated membrane protein n=1 Tax=Rothia sp. ZJ932 TaxID=2810516 RepID=UPI001966F5E1|nr:MauE/DoxX family redox-associated membrane protein [Rothia sp. ZJ932]QRZ61302.1 hypothetical protein JR346_08675 [Rothia sp. ZJ932]
MESLLLFSLILVVTLAVSGAAKVKDYTSTATAIFNLKIDKWLPVRVKTAAKILPWAEIALAVVLLFAPGILQVIATFCALLLFAFYWVVIARAVMSGNTASCNCFGTASSAPISRWTLARNTALVLAAVVVVAGAFADGRAPLMMLLDLTLEQWFWLAGAALASATLWFIYRSETIAPVAAPAESVSVASPAAATAHQGRVQEVPASANPYADSQFAEESVEKDYVRLPIPFGNIAERNGQVHTLRQLAATQARVLIWVSPGCGSCLGIIPEFERWQEKLGSLVGVHPVVRNEEAAQRLEVPESVRILIDNDGNAQANFGDGTPMAIAMGADGLMAGGPVWGKKAVIKFMDDLLAEFDA